MRIPFDSTHVVIYSFFSFTVMMEFPVGQDEPHGGFRLVNKGDITQSDVLRIL